MPIQEVLASDPKFAGSLSREPARGEMLGTGRYGRAFSDVSAPKHTSGIRPRWLQPLALVIHPRRAREQPEACAQHPGLGSR
jgi:hypothetical protein